MLYNTEISAAASHSTGYEHFLVSCFPDDHVRVVGKYTACTVRMVVRARRMLPTKQFMRHLLIYEPLRLARQHAEWKTTPAMRCGFYTFFITIAMHFITHILSCRMKLLAVEIHLTLTIINNMANERTNHITYER